MNGAHLHLLLNHVSLFALIFGVVALMAAMKRRSADLRSLATMLFVITGVFAWIAVETGEKAEDVLKAAGLSAESLIEQHEGAAEWALRSAIVVACLAVAMEWAARKNPRWLKHLQWTLMVVAIHGCTVFARTAFLGGQIRHTEIHEAQTGEPKP